jgi:hypothetical protein
MGKTTFPMLSHKGQPPIPDAMRKAELRRLRGALAEHIARRPGWTDINARAIWANQKDLILEEIGIQEGTLQNRWHPVDVRHA